MHVCGMATQGHTPPKVPGNKYLATPPALVQRGGGGKAILQVQKLVSERREPEGVGVGHG